MKTCWKQEHKLPVNVRGSKTSLLKLPINVDGRPNLTISHKNYKMKLPKIFSHTQPQARFPPLFRVWSALYQLRVGSIPEQRLVIEPYKTLSLELSLTHKAVN